MKKVYVVFLFMLFVSCKKDKATSSSIVVFSPNRSFIFETGDTIAVCWHALDTSARILVTLENHAMFPTREIPLVPFCKADAFLITYNDGQEQYYLPWCYSDEGRIVYGQHFGVQRFCVRVSYAYQDSLFGLWHESATHGWSPFFQINRKVGQEGCDRGN